MNRRSDLTADEIEVVRNRVIDGDFFRADGRCECPKCYRLYHDHPCWPEAPTFHLLCTGEIVKT